MKSYKVKTISRKRNIINLKQLFKEAMFLYGVIFFGFYAFIIWGIPNINKLANAILDVLSIWLT